MYSQPNEFSVDDARYLAGTLLSCAFAFAIPHIPQSKRRLASGIFSSIVFAVGAGIWSVGSLVWVVLCHLLLNIHSGPWIAILNFIFIIGLKAVDFVAIKRIGESVINDNWVGSQMILCLKISSIAFEQPVYNLPLSDLILYSFDINGSLTGAPSELSQWKDYMKEPECKGDPIAAIKRLLIATWWIFLTIKYRNNAVEYAKGLRKFPSPIKTTITSDILASFVFRTKYYAIWEAFRVCGLASGIASAGGRDPNTWCNVHEGGFESAHSCIEVSREWNIIAANWFRNYVYTPLRKKGVSYGVATIVTNLISALWHGVQPGDFAFFLLIAVGSGVAQFEHKNIEPGFKLPKTKTWKIASVIYDALKIALTQYYVSSVSMFFIVKEFKHFPGILKRCQYRQIWIPMVEEVLFIAISKIPHFKFWANEAKNMKNESKKKIDNQ